MYARSVAHGNGTFLITMFDACLEEIDFALGDRIARRVEKRFVNRLRLKYILSVSNDRKSGTNTAVTAVLISAEATSTKFVN